MNRVFSGPYGVRVVDLSKNRIHRIPDNIGANDSLESLVRQMMTPIAEIAHVTSGISPANNPCRTL